MPKLDLTHARRVMTPSGEARAIKAGPGLWRSRKPLLDAPGVIALHAFDPLWTHPDLAGAGIGQADAHAARVTDLGGGGHHATQPTLAHQPLLKRLGALWWLHFDGGSDRLVVAPGVWRGPDMSLVLVVRLPADYGAQVTLAGSAASTGIIARYQDGSSLTAISNVFADRFFANGTQVTGTVDFDRLHGLWATGGWVIAEATGWNATLTAFDGGLQVLGRGATSGLVAGDLGAAIILPTALADAHRAALTATLSNLFGITP